MRISDDELPVALQAARVAYYFSNPGSKTERAALKLLIAFGDPEFVSDKVEQRQVITSNEAWILVRGLRTIIRLDSVNKEACHVLFARAMIESEPDL